MTSPRTTILSASIAALLLAAAPRPGAHARGADQVDVALGIVPDLSGAPLPVIPPVFDGQHVSGTVFIGYRGTDGETTAAIATISPGWGAFVRLGAAVTPGSRADDLGFLWGLGVERAQDRTFFLHVDDWGPIAPGEPFTLRTAQASAGYKLPMPCGRALCLASSAFATAPFSGGPYLGARASLTLHGTWFATGALGWTIPGALPGSASPPPWRASFALGRADLRPGGLFVTYRDAASLEGLRGWTRTSRQGTGVVAAGVSWAY
ncbi:hypothetical protein [Anaeromyxobacter oryzae]|uniref:Uncharacterized protein n=1 Tax=Anaeromyxobacter oryzae TaxID=2918170 RepID=A0ABN6MUJ2_9BACT|nr:hypothetical protein [Anaeromyxobacter oryzae]BDG03423.1 hypothetical protein AMOR_24190 [Anaeromyxobacter oryzae]